MLKTVHLVRENLLLVSLGVEGHKTDKQCDRQHGLILINNRPVLHFGRLRDVEHCAKFTGFFSPNNILKMMHNTELSQNLHIIYYTLCVYVFTANLVLYTQSYLNF